MSDLLFRAAQTSDPNLLFGANDGPPPPQDSTIAIVGNLPRLRGSVPTIIGTPVSLVATMPRLRGSITTNWDSRTERPLVGRVVAPFEDGERAVVGVASDYQQAQQIDVPTEPVWQDAQRVNSMLQGIWDEADRIQRITRSIYEEAIAAVSGTFGGFQDGVRLRHGSTSLYQDGDGLVQGRTSKFQEAFRDRRNYTAGSFQDGVAYSTGAASSFGFGLPYTLVVRGPYQEAWPPRPGVSQRPQPPVPDPCYLPDPNLLFAQTPGGPDLLFVCERHGPGPEPSDPIIIPVQRVYVVVNDAVLVRLPSGDIIPTLRMSMSLDVDSWTWSFSASLPWQALSLVQPVAGDPVEVQATVNDHDFRFVVERISADRTFGSRSLSVSGRGRAAVLDAPYAPISTFGNGTARTAQQLMNDVLTFNGVPLGWNIDWRITDWNVPGNVWTHQGTYISALTSIAQAPGAYIQPHPTAQTLIVLPRYPSMPHQWGSLPVDYVIPADVSTREGLEWEDLPTYERVFVSGTSAGVIAQVTRAGTSGELVKPVVTDPLITHVDAARQRGVAELSPAGRRTMLTMRTPVFTDAGVITPGKMVQYTDGGTTRLGLVRGVQVDVGLPEIWQSLELESYES